MKRVIYHIFLLIAICNLIIVGELKAEKSDNEYFDTEKVYSKVIDKTRINISQIKKMAIVENYNQLRNFIHIVIKQKTNDFIHDEIIFTDDIMKVNIFKKWDKLNMFFWTAGGSGNYGQCLIITFKDSEFKVIMLADDFKTLDSKILYNGHDKFFLKIILLLENFQFLKKMNLTVVLQEGR